MSNSRKNIYSSEQVAIEDLKSDLLDFEECDDVELIPACISTLARTSYSFSTIRDSKEFKELKETVEKRIRNLQANHLKNMKIIGDEYMKDFCHLNILEQASAENSIQNDVNEVYQHAENEVDAQCNKPMITGIETENLIKIYDRKDFGISVGVSGAISEICQGYQVMI